MEVSAYNLVLTLIAIGVLTLTTWAIVVTLEELKYLSKLSERILVAITTTVLIMNAEVYLFSVIPTGRPLTFLPVLHTLGLISLITWTIRRRGWRPWIDSLHKLRNSVHGALAESGVIVTFLLLFVAGLMLYYFLYGAYTITWDWDAVDYHVPMAVQPYQDGRIGRIGSNLPWTDAYPRGVELVWYWTLQWTHSDLLLHPTQLAFGLQLLLATYVLARRSDVKTWAALTASAVIGATPLMSILTTTGNIDIGYGAGVVTMVAFLAPPRDLNQPALRDWLPATLAYGQACLIKAPILATLFALVIVACFTISQYRHVGVRTLIHWGRSWRRAAAFAIVLLCCHAYITNAIRYANPLYPMAVSVWGLQVLPGPLNSSMLGQGAFSLMGDVTKMTRLQQYYAAWADIFQPLNLQSLGSPGLVFITVVFFGFLMFALHALSHRVWWHLTLVLIFGLGFLVPASFLPRYSIPMLVIGVVGAHWTFQQLPNHMLNGFRISLVLLCILACFPGIRAINEIITWIKSSNGGKLLVARRNLITLENGQLGIAGMFPTPKTIQFLHDHSGPGDTLVWNVRAFHGMLWNRTYSNRVIFLEGTPNDSFPSTSYGRSKLSDVERAKWLAAVKQLQPKHILVYVHSAYAKYLQSELNHAYRVAHQDIDNGDTGAMIIFERAATGGPPKK